MIRRKKPPIIWKDDIDMPIKIKKELPYIEKKINTVDVIKSTNPESLIVFFMFKPCVIIVKIGIREIGSIATKAFKKF
tara:strand:- start:4 stop:237 length:234 start_codon:yes stop_codon:yes gene_type:complete